MSDSAKYVKENRVDYSSTILNEVEMSHDPIQEFEKWFESALKAGYPEPNAMNLSTVSVNNQPSSRIVLLREFDANGFIFYTNYNSKKGKDLDQNPLVCLNFFWNTLQKQIRIDGSISKISEDKSNNYFKSRPKNSQIGTWASAQSNIIPGRDYLDKQFEFYSEKFRNSEVPRPENWGGYLVKPTRFEFWQGRSDRMHDRIQYSLQENSKWIKERLSP